MAFSWREGKHNTRDGRKFTKIDPYVKQRGFSKEELDDLEDYENDDEYLDNEKQKGNKQ